MSEEEKKDEKKDAGPKPRVQIRDLTSEGAEKDKELRYTKRFFMTWETEDGTIEEGEFVIKRPTIGEQARIGVICAELRNDKPMSSIDHGTASLHEWIATSRVVVQKAPPWFKPDDMYDNEPLLRVYEEALKFHNSFRNKRLVK